jgi:hypothetical protein
MPAITEFQSVTQVDCLEDAADFVIAIGAFSQDFQSQIYLGGGLQGQHTNTQLLYTVIIQIGKGGKLVVKSYRDEPGIMRRRLGREKIRMEGEELGYIKAK